jgi:hypothetical protein
VGTSVAAVAVVVVVAAVAAAVAVAAVAVAVAEDGKILHGHEQDKDQQKEAEAVAVVDEWDSCQSLDRSAFAEEEVVLFVFSLPHTPVDAFLRVRSPLVDDDRDMDLHFDSGEEAVVPL